MIHFAWWVYLLLAMPGIFIFVMNWGIFFNNISGKKWVSSVFLIGGLWIAIVCLISPYKWLALAGLADPGVWLIFHALINRAFSGKNKTEDKKDAVPEDK